ncbi:MAG: cyclodeaminase/cyclohydrolase family protein [Planctomycetes bacterium]|nr:cyclodeaminase/cyclohydrolase family protein [Planctomycetota bacterium]
MDDKNDLLNLSVRDFAAAVAAKTPTPGGGSVAGVVGALGVALGEMALNFTIGKKAFAQHAEFHSHAAERLKRARTMFEQLVADDVAAYGLYAETSKRPDGAEKDQAMQLALAAAVNVPRQAAKLAVAVMEDLLGLADKCNKYLLSDLKAGAVLAMAAIMLSDYNVRINVPQLADAQAAADVSQASTADIKRAGELMEQIEKICTEK